MTKFSRFLPIVVILFIFGFIFRDVLFKQMVPLPSDTLVGAYYPWLDYKWGFATGVPVKNALLSDAFSHFFVFKTLAAKNISNWHLPLWNSFTLAGLPLLAAYHTSTLFPGNFLLLLPQPSGWSLYIIGSTIFCALTMYLYLAGHIKNPWARVIGAIVFATAGPMTTWLEFGTGVWAAGFIPLLLLCLDQAIIKKKTLFWSVFSVLLAFMILAGHVQIDTYLAFLLPLYVIVTARANNKSIFGSTLLFLLFGTIGGALAAMQLLPTYELYKHSIRGEENYAASFHYGLVALPQLIRLWIADFYGNPSTNNQWGEYIYHEYSSFIGTLSIPLIVVLLFKQNKNYIEKFFLSLLFLSLLLVVQSPISEKIFSLPLPLLTYSSASRLFFLTTLAAGILVAFAINHLLVSPKYIKKIFIVCFVFIAITLISIKIVPQTYQTIAFRNSLLPIIILFCLPFLTLLLKKVPQLALLLLLILISFDMGRYLLKYNPIVSPQTFFPSTPVIDFLKSQPGVFRIAREKDNLLPPNTWVYYGLESVEGYEPLRPLAYSRLFHRLENRPFTNTASRYSELLDINPPYLDALNVKYVLALKRDQQNTDDSYINKLIRNHYRLVFSDKHTLVYESTTYKPRAFFVDKVLYAPNDSILADTLNDPRFDPTAQAVTEKNIDTILSSGQIEILKYESDFVSLKTKNTGEGFVVISNNNDPGWKATVDGSTTQIVQTDGSLQGIRLSPGEHFVKLTYSPDSFRNGLYISVTSLLVLILMSVIMKTKPQLICLQ